jgi:hypothetical protein
MGTMTAKTNVTGRKEYIGRGDLTKERRDWPELPREEIWEGIARLEKEYAETLISVDTAQTMPVAPAIRQLSA